MASIPLILSPKSFTNWLVVKVQASIIFFGGPQSEGVGHETVGLKEVQLNILDIKVAVDGVAKEVFRGGEERAGKQK